MSRLTEKDSQGNWRLKGVPWESLYTGTVITEDVRQKLYGALHKLMDYEDTGLCPGEAAELKDFNETSIARLLKELAFKTAEQHRWIPVEERLPADGTEVLVTIDGCVEVTTYYEYGLDCGWDSWEDCGVLAWMPMPEPYRGGTP